MREQVHQEIIDGVTYTLYIEEEDIPVRGNLCATGDDEVDRQAEREVLEALGQGRLWAWCTVIVTASIDDDEQQFSGSDYLGSCSYSGVEEFIEPGGYYRDMRHIAYQRLSENLELAARRGEVAGTLLDQLMTSEAR